MTTTTTTTTTMMMLLTVLTIILTKDKYTKIREVYMCVIVWLSAISLDRFWETFKVYFIGVGNWIDLDETK